ncbi:hypothetical protein A9Q88_08195 [Gammaproteobacteria bacterium 50_400_T64]|nr:hypothetical protein A9Q88_08195 [Gammaproteobacteria bacterium 50_400_T64]
MKYLKRATGLPVLALMATPLMTPVASAIDVSVSGFIRQDMAWKLTNDDNYVNRGGNPLNGVPITSPNGIDITKVDKSTENDWNVFATKAELDFDISISNNWSARVKFRGVYQPDVFEDSSYAYQGENGNRKGDDVDHFGVKNFSNGEATYLSHSEDNYMIDIPSLYLDYAKGPLWVRIGNQQIAWGEALFFRVADVANGLDLRRHLFLDFGAEEYSDERLSSPGVRATYRLNDNWEIEGFAQMFQPTVLPTRNSPYNLILSGFAQNYHEGFQKVENQINGGVRLMGTFGDLGVQFFAVSRHNPDPIFRLVPGGQTDGPFGAASFGPSGQTFADQPFIYTGWENGAYVSQGDASTAPQEWMYQTGLAGLDGTAVVNGLARTYPFLEEFYQNVLGLTPDLNNNGEYFTGVTDVAGNANGMSTYDILFAFYEAGSIDGNITPTYAAEDVFGFGFNYIFYREPGSFLDQLVVRFEASYTPDKKFTANDLSPDWIVEDEYVTSFILEKYHRFSDSFPATFFIFEWMHKSESDMLGRHLSGLGGTATRRGNSDAYEDRGWDGLVFAFQQPFPNLTWRADLSVLYDLNGGIFIQPAVRYKPSSTWTVEAFANIIDSKDNASIFAATDWSDDFTVRITYQF